MTARPLISLIDTHCHLEMSDFDPDRQEVINRAFDAGFEALITVGSSFEGTQAALLLAEKYDRVYASVGVHPHDAARMTPEMFDKLTEWSALPKVVAIGESGLDYHYDRSPREVQASVFRQHLELARQSGLPAIIHSREAASDTMDIIRKSGISKGVLHCFSGDREMAFEAMSLGLYISLAGPVTFKKASALKEIARLVPDDYLLVETDSPFLAPEPLRGRRNEPLFMEHTARHIAELRGISLEDLARMTTLNAKRLFKVGQIAEKAEIAYKIRDSLYLNITNRCTNACSFCVRYQSDYVKGHKLRLDHEPGEFEIKEAIGNPAAYREVVFCGYGEPLTRLDLVKEIASWVKLNGGTVRINTNGQANLINGRNVVPELKNLVDSVSISLDAQDRETYNRICNPAYDSAYEAVLEFIKLAKGSLPSVRVTVVETEGVDVEKCRAIAAGLGVAFSVRKLDDVG
ncbi:MAG: YchF/TatD family DNA exonuclease [Nitrospirae bacterium]|nr:YchF/TatD family DNA exonuclease [Nitrospirota bacterium]